VRTPVQKLACAKNFLYNLSLPWALSLWFCSWKYEVSLLKTAHFMRYLNILNVTQYFKLRFSLSFRWGGWSSRIPFAMEGLGGINFLEREGDDFLTNTNMNTDIIPVTIRTLVNRVIKILFFISNNFY
jgi:hypothetical protein